MDMLHLGLGDALDRFLDIRSFNHVERSFETVYSRNVTLSVHTLCARSEVGGGLVPRR